MSSARACGGRCTHKTGPARTGRVAVIGTTDMGKATVSNGSKVLGLLEILGWVSR